MTEMEEGAPNSLHQEAQSLRAWLRLYRQDRKLLKENEKSQQDQLLNKEPPIVFVDFIDAHDVNAFINPDNPSALKGFALNAEMLSDDPDVVSKLKLKSDQLLRKLLFSGSQIGLLPPHGEEVDEEVAFHQMKRQHRELSTLVSVRNAIGTLKKYPIEQAFLKSGTEDGTSTTPNSQVESKVDLLIKAAPVVLTWLRPQPGTPEERIEAILQHSGLVGLTELAWEAFGLTPVESDVMRQTRPQPERVEQLREYLSKRTERGRNSTRSNRIDAEAIAYIEALNSCLSRFPGCKVRARLVTRAMTLLKASFDLEETQSELKTPNCLRHPRMLAQPDPEGFQISDDTVAPFEVALETFAEQLCVQASSHRDARVLFVKAWEGFEGARLAKDLRMEAQGSRLPGRRERFDEEGEAQEQRMRQLLNLLQNDDVFRTIVADEMSRVRKFGQDTYFMSRSADVDPIEALITYPGNGPRARIRPLLAGVPGPVELNLSRYGKCEPICFNLETLLADVSESHTERYLAWAVLHACRRSWGLAEIYARGAVNLGKLLKEPEGSRLEASLLLAQVQRLRGLDGDPHERVSNAIKRYIGTLRRLKPSRPTDNPRVLHECAVHLIELALACGEQLPARFRVAEGLQWLRQAVALSRDNNDSLMEARSLSMLLTYVLAAVRHRIVWPDEEGEAVQAARQWHSELNLALSKEPSVDEIPRRTRAMQIIAYVVTSSSDLSSDTTTSTATSEQSPIPSIQDALHFAPELHDQIKESLDRTGLLIASELQALVGTAKRSRLREVNLAPAWSHSRWQQSLGEVEGAEELRIAIDAHAILVRATNPPHAIPDPVQRRFYVRVSRMFSTLIDLRRAVLFATRNGSSPADLPSTALMRPPPLYLWTDAAYAQLLVALVTVNPEKRNHRLRLLLDEYKLISEHYPEAAIPHFRRYLVCKELLQSGVGEDLLREEAEHELSQALEKAPLDSQLEPGHWIFSTLKRERASVLEDMSRSLREAASGPEPFRNTPTESIDLLREAFLSVYPDFDVHSPPGTDRFAALEHLWRINSIVHSATQYLLLTGNWSELAESGFTQDTLTAYTRRLYTREISEVTEISIVHTIGCAYSLLGERGLAIQAAQRLSDLIALSGVEVSKDNRLIGLVSDAISWYRNQAVSWGVVELRNAV